uniref:Fatty acyl-CoA reductase n=1 Tax=Culicoides sonorensis TaxID=179676 RepID=A0A336KLL9_CULSO
MEMVPQKISIKQFYKGKTILITGGTGFLGKILIEKLLWSCNDLEKIILILRSKKGKSVEERIASLKREVVFKRIHDRNPSVLNKIIGIEADLSAGSFNSESDLMSNELKNVNIIFHCAASVRFDDPLKKAIMINVCATKALLDFAKTLKHFDVFIHVSTAYSNCDRLEIDEKLYPLTVNWEHSIQMAQTMDEDTLDALFYKISNNMPNTYVFTKKIAENMINAYKNSLPIVIFRPSVVTSAEEEPLPGFIDNFNGPVGLLIASMTGINRVMYQNKVDSHVNTIPVDICIKGMIIAAVYRALQCQNGNLPIFNGASIKNIQIDEFIERGIGLIENIPPNFMFWRTGGRVTTYKLEFYLRLIFTQILPALIADTFLAISNKKPKFMKLQRTLRNAQKSVQYFIDHNFNIFNANFLKLNEILIESEVKEFEIKEKLPNLDDYIKVCTIGARRYLMNWPDEDLEQAKVNYWRMKWIDRICKFLISICFGRILYTRLYFLIEF